MPQLDFAFIADAAEAEPGRKIYVVGGGIDSIAAPAFPVVHPMMSLVMRIAVHHTETERAHALEIRLIDADGGQLATISGQFQVGPPLPPPGRQIAINRVVNFFGTRFERPGDYSIEILINGQHMKSLPLHLHVMAPPPGN